MPTGLRCLSRGLATLAAAALAIPLASAQDTLLSFGVDGSYFYGLRVATVGDTDGDGLTELLVGNPSYTQPGSQCGSHGRFSLHTGADGSELFSDYGYKCQLYTADAVSATGDQNGDGVTDFFVATHEMPVALLYSGADGALLWIFTDPPKTTAPVLACLGDVDGDGVDELVIGSSLPASGPGTGEVRIYKGGSFSLLYTLVGDATTYSFGRSLAVIGDVDLDGARDLAVGAPYAPWPTPGSVQVFSGRTGTKLFMLLGEVPASSASGTEGFGQHVSAAGDVNADGWPDIVVSLFQDKSAQSLGKVRVYSGRDGSLLLGLHPGGNEPSFGSAISQLGDVDLDSHDDVAVSDPYPSTAVGQGRVYLFSGRTGALIKSIDWTAPEYLYGGLAPAGDVNGDGFPDIVAGGEHTVQILSGRVKPEPGPWLISETNGSNVGEEFGAAVAGAGDGDADGHEDLAVGAPSSDAGGFDSGEVRLLSGQDASVLFDVPGVAPGERFGSAVAAGGDVDGDGRDDVIAGAPLGSFAGQPTGIARLLSGADGSTLREWHGEGAGDAFGTAVCAAGDVDADGSPDLAVGAPYRSTLKPNAGALYVFSGATGNLIRQLEGQTSQARLGRALAPIGDFDRDGTPDLVAGAPGEKLGGDQLGAVRVVSGANGATLLSVLGTDPGGNFGQAIAPAGDFDLDGRPDILVGSPSESTGPLDPSVGAIRIVSGADGSILFAKLATESTTPLGGSVAGGDDVDADGRPDFLVGRPGVAGVPGAVDVRSGDGGGLLATLAGESDGDQFGVGLALADVDGDGIRDAVVGASQGGPPESSPGRVATFAFARNWNPFPGGLEGIAGIPELSGTGGLVPGAIIGVHLANAAPFAPAVMVIGLGMHLVPFKGGVVVPTPDLLLGFTCNGAGAAGISAVWPSTWPPGASFLLQAWIHDAAGPHGFSASNALEGTPF